jgi:hypothetical protein
MKRKVIEPSAWDGFSTYQYSESDSSAAIQESWRDDIAPSAQEFWRQLLRRQFLSAFCPFSLFFTRYGHSFTDPDMYLWEPPIGTVIQSVEVQGDTVVLTLTVRQSTLTLRMDRTRNWLLLDAKCQETVDGEIHESLDVREYGELVNGVPLLKKRSVSKTGENYRSTEEMELVRFDSTPVDESVFREDNLPFRVPKTVRMSVEQRMHRHWLIAGCRLGIPLLVIFVCQFRRKKIINTVASEIRAR